MVETALVYIYRTKPAKQFVGCGVVITDGYIATCRHVWRDATTAFANEADGEPRADVEYQHAWRDGARITSGTSLADPCRAGPDGPEPDLVLLRPDTVPDNLLRLTPASDPRFETGPGYSIAGLPGRDASNPSVVQETNVPGVIANTIRSDRRRQFTGSNPQSYWTDRGSSGSPVFLDTGEQLAGIISLSETGRKSGESPIHEAFVVPGTVIRRYLDTLIAVRKAAQQAHVPAARLQPILDIIGAADTPAEEIPDRLRSFVEDARARAAEPVAASNDGADIDAAVGAARDKLRDLDAAGARKVLQDKIEEEEASRRRRLLPLLRERAAVERLAFDHEAAKATLIQLTQLDPDDVWQWIDLGDLWVTTGPGSAALEAYRNAQTAARRAGDERDLSVSHNRIGDLQRAQGDLAGALASYAAAMTIREALASRDPANSEWQRDLSVSHERIGDVRQAQGDLAGALASYAAAMTIREALASRDPANSEWQRDLSVSHNKIGDVRQAQGDLAGALASYAAAMTIREALAARDPANSEWQRDLSVSHDKIGDVQRAQGDLAGALASYAAAMTIREALASRDPANSQWQRDLSVSHNKIGDVQQAQGDLAGALASYAAAMTIREALASRDPANSQWQRDLIVSCVRLADTAPDQARTQLTRALAIARDLAGSGRLAPVDQWMPADLERRLAGLRPD